MQNIEEIYKQHSNAVYKYLFCLTGNADISEELTQETFAIAVKEIKKFKGNCKVSVWLCQIAKYLWYKELKKKSRKNISIEEIEEVEETKTVEDIICDNDDKIRLFKDIQKLDEKTKEVAIYRLKYPDVSLVELSEIISIETGKQISKSGIYHRFNKIKEMAKKIKED